MLFRIGEYDKRNPFGWSWQFSWRRCPLPDRVGNEGNAHGSSLGNTNGQYRGLFFDRRILGTVLPGLQQFINASFPGRWFLRRLHNLFDLLERERPPAAVGQLYGFHSLCCGKCRLWNLCRHGRVCPGQINSGSDGLFRFGSTVPCTLGLRPFGEPARAAMMAGARRIAQASRFSGGHGA